MTTYTDVFSGNPIQPSQRSERTITLAATTTLSWPFADLDTTDVTADIMEVSASAGSLLLKLPPANQVSNGTSVIVRNTGSNAFTVADNGGNTIQAITAGLVYFIYLTDNSTVNGTWSKLQLGTGTSSADAGTLAGFGLTASGLTLNTVIPIVPLSANANITSTYRSQGIRWTGGTGTLTVTSSFFGPNGPYFYVYNDGTGTVTIAGTSIDGGTSLTLDPTESVLMSADATGNMFPLAQHEIFGLISAANFVTATSSSLTLTASTPGAQAYEITNAAGTDVMATLPAQGSLYVARYVPVSSGTPNYAITFTSSEGFPVVLYPGLEKVMSGGGTQPRDVADSTQKAGNQNHAFFGDITSNPWGLGTTFTSNGTNPIWSADRFVGTQSGGTTSVSWSRQTSTDTGFGYDMRVQRTNANTSVRTMELYGVLTGSESYALRGKTLTVVMRLNVGSTNFTTVAARYCYRTSTSADTNPVSDTSWTTDAGGPYVAASFPLTDYSTYAYKGAAVIPVSATQVAIRFTVTCTGTATASDYLNLSYLGLHEGDYFGDYARLPAGQAWASADPGAAENMAEWTGTASMTYSSGTGSHILTITSNQFVPVESSGAKFPNGKTFAFIAPSSNTSQLVDLYVNGNVTAALYKKSDTTAGYSPLAPNDIRASNLSYIKKVDGSTFVLLDAPPYSYGGSISSSTSIDLDSSPTGDLVDLTSTGTISSITLAEGRERTVRFTQARTLTNTTLIILPTGTNITTASGDFAIIRGYSGGITRVVAYQKADGRALLSTNTSATQAEMEAGTSTSAPVTPSVAQYHQAAAKAWARVTITGTSPALSRSYNCSSVTRTSTGTYAIQFTTAFSDTNYAFLATCDNPSAIWMVQQNSTAPTTTACTFIALNTSGTATDPGRFSVVFFGDQ